MPKTTYINIEFTINVLPSHHQVPIIIPAFVLCAAVFLVIAPIVADPQMEFLYATVMILAGLILYFPFVYFRLQLPGMGKYYLISQYKCTTFIKYLLNAAVCDIFKTFCI